MADKAASAAGSALARKRWIRAGKAERAATNKMLNDARWAARRAELEAEASKRKSGVTK